MGNATALAGLLLLFGATTASPVSAQTVSVDGAYARLSPGNAKIAQALYEAQVSVPMPTRSSATGTRTGAAPRALTLDQIAAHKQGGQGWGRIFDTMKAQGLVPDKNLGQVVMRYEHHQLRTSGVVTAAAHRGDRALAAHHLKSDAVEALGAGGHGNPGQGK